MCCRISSNEKLRIKNAKRNDSNAFSDFDSLNQLYSSTYTVISIDLGKEFATDFVNFWCLEMCKK
jgi:hypothetical protein